MSYQERAKNVLDCLLNKNLGSEPIVFICHSLGGIIVKQLLRIAQHHQNFNCIFRATRSVAFLATPHTGSVAADLLVSFGIASKEARQLGVDDPALRDLNDWYREAAVQSQIQTVAFAETQKTAGFPIVKLTDADPGVAGCVVIPIDANHITITKPANYSDQICESICRFVRESPPVLAAGFSGQEDSRSFLQLLSRLSAFVRNDHVERRTRMEEGTFVSAEISGSASPSTDEADAETSDDLKLALDEADRLANEGYADDADAVYLRCIAQYQSPAAFNQYGVFLLRCNHVPQATVMFRKVEALAAKAGLKWYSMAFANLGLICRVKHDLSGAASYFNQALDIDRKLERTRGVAIALGNLGIVDQMRGSLDSAERHFHEALRLAEGSQWITILAAQHGNLGRLYLARDELVAAETSMCRGLELEKRLGRRDSIADVTSTLGLILRSAGNLNRAEELLREALKINELLGRVAVACDQYADLGIVYLKRGSLREAEDLLNTGLRLSMSSGQRSSVAHVKNYFGLLFKEQGDLNRAEQMHCEALQVYELLQMHSYKADQLSHIGSICEAKGEIDRAFANWQSAALIYRSVQQSAKAELLDSWAVALTGKHLPGGPAASFSQL